jgi:hypothetical protein
VADVYSTNFLDLHAAALGIGYEVPAGFKAIVRDIDVFFTALAVINLNIIGPSGGTFAYFSYIPSGSAFQDWRGRQVFSPGDVIGVTGTIDAGSFDLRMSGYLLTLP